MRQESLEVEVDDQKVDDVVVEENKKNDYVVSRTALVGMGIAFLSVFIDILGVSIILPVIPFLALKFDASSQQIGFIYAGYAGAQMISVPISGMLSDRFGRRPLMILSLFGSCVGFLFQGLSWNITTFLMARVLAGLFGGSIPICQSYIADVIPVEQRGRYFAILGSVIVVAFLFGPGIGAGLAEFSLQTPMLVSSAIAGCGFMLAVFFFREPVKLKDKTDEIEIEITSNSVEVDSNSPQDKDSMLGDSNKYGSRRYTLIVRFLWMVSFFNMLGFSSVIYFLGLFVYDQFGWGTLEVGFTTMLMGIFQVTVQILLFPKLQGRLGKHGCGILGTTSSSFGLLLFGFVTGDTKDENGLPLMAIALAFSAFGTAVTIPSLSATLSRYASQKKQGATLGVAQSAEALARTVGPLLWGAIYAYSRHLPFHISACFYVIAGLLICIVLCFNLKLPEHQQLDTVESSAAPALKSLDQLSKDEQIQSLLAENALLKEKLNKYENAYVGEDQIEMSDIMELPRG